MPKRLPDEEVPAPGAPGGASRPISDDTLIYLVENGGKAAARRRKVSYRTFLRHVCQRGKRLRDLTDEVRGRKTVALFREGLTIGEVARKVGFSGVPAFCRFVKRTRGETASALRERALADVEAETEPDAAASGKRKTQP